MTIREAAQYIMNNYQSESRARDDAAERKLRAYQILNETSDPEDVLRYLSGEPDPVFASLAAEFLASGGTTFGELFTFVDAKYKPSTEEDAG